MASFSTSPTLFKRIHRRNGATVGLFTVAFFVFLYFTLSLVLGALGGVASFPLALLAQLSALHPSLSSLSKAPARGTAVYDSAPVGQFGLGNSPPGSAVLSALKMAYPHVLPFDTILNNPSHSAILLAYCALRAPTHTFRALDHNVLRSAYETASRSGHDDEFVANSELEVYANEVCRLLPHQPSPPTLA